MNTGKVIYGNLKKVYKGITDENGNPIPVLDGFGREIKKCNIPTDPDYIPPIINLGLCPTSYIVATTTVPLTTTTVPITTTTVPGSCEFNINSVSNDCANPNYILMEAKTSISNGIVNVTITSLNETIIRSNITVINGSVFFQLPYTMAASSTFNGNIIIYIQYGICTKQIAYTLQCTNTFTCLLLPVICAPQTTSTTSTTSPVSTTSTSSTSSTSTTTVPVCTLNSITTSVILPNQIQVDYNGHHIDSFTCTIRSGTSVVEIVNVTSWSGNTFYINLLNPLCNGTYSVEVKPDDCPTLLKSSNVTITTNICCSIDIQSITYLSATQIRVVANITGVGYVNAEIIQGESYTSLGPVNVTNGLNTFVLNYAALPNGAYTLKLSRGMSCQDTQSFNIVNTTVAPCHTFSSVTATYNAGTDSYNFVSTPLPNPLPASGYNLSFRINGDLFLNVPNSYPNFSLGRIAFGYNIEGQLLEITFHEPISNCIQIINVNVPNR